MLPLLAEESLPPDTSWEFSFAVGHTGWPHSTRTGERQSIPRNAGRFCNSDHTCTSLLYEVTTCCSRKNSPSWCRNSRVQFSQNKPRIPVSKTPPPAQSLLNSLPPSFCKDAAIRSQLCFYSSSLLSPLSLLYMTTTAPSRVSLKSHTPPWHGDSPATFYRETICRDCALQSAGKKVIQNKAVCKLQSWVTAVQVL